MRNAPSFMLPGRAPLHKFEPFTEFVRTDMDREGTMKEVKRKWFERVVPHFTSDHCRRHQPSGEQILLNGWEMTRRLARPSATAATVTLSRL